MAREQRQVVQEPEIGQTGCLPAFLRLTWMMFGNIALIFAAMFVAKGTMPVGTDIVFLAVAVGLILVRYVDISFFKGGTSEGEPATLTDWRRYAVLVALVSAALWVFARFVAYRGWL